MDLRFGESMSKKIALERITPLASSTRVRKVSLSPRLLSVSPLASTPTKLSVSTTTRHGNKAPLLAMARNDEGSSVNDDEEMPDLEFGEFAVRKASSVNQFMAAANVRARVRFPKELLRVEGKPVARCNRSLKELDEIMGRINTNDSIPYTCVIAAKKEGWKKYNDREYHLYDGSYVMGSLDLSTKEFLTWETFPGEQKGASDNFAIFRSRSKDSSKYGLIENFLVEKSAHAHAAKSILQFALDSAKSNGLKTVYVHARGDEEHMDLFLQMGFKVVEKATRAVEASKLYLLKHTC